MKAKNSEVEKVRADLDIEEHIRMQENGWRFQAVGLCGLFALVFSAALGLYGDGILSKKTVTKNSTELEYQRFFRFEAEMEMKVKASTSEDVKVAFPTDYLNHFEITSIVPEQKNNQFKTGHVEYVFAADDHAEITFYMTPKNFGTIEGSVSINDKLFPVNHFIFP